VGERRFPFVPNVPVFNPDDVVRCNNCGAVVRADQTFVVSPGHTAEGHVKVKTACIRCEGKKS